MIQYDDIISARAQAIDVSGIRRVFELGATLADPINFSIGQKHHQLASKHRHIPRRTNRQGL